MIEPQVILVTPNDEPIAVMDKMEAHIKGLLHRAFSVFLFNDKGEWLLQQRAWHKYHSPGLWTNACCSHQMPNESNQEAAARRLMEEMGIASVDLHEAFSFVYEVRFDNGLIEHEFDHVLIGSCNADPIFNEDEVAGFKWISEKELEQWLIDYPDHFTFWFKTIFEKVKHFRMSQPTIG
jgi:isopentenyl-diphosphate delta-isomerase